MYRDLKVQKPAMGRDAEVVDLKVQNSYYPFFLFLIGPPKCPLERAFRHCNVNVHCVTLYCTTH